MCNDRKRGRTKPTNGREREREREKASQLCQPASTMAVAGDSLGGRLTRTVSWSDKVWEIIHNYELWFVMREVTMLHNYASDGLLESCGESCDCSREFESDWSRVIHPTTWPLRHLSAKIFPVFLMENNPFVELLDVSTQS